MDIGGGAEASPGFTFREWKTGEKQGRPGSIHHVSRREVDVGGGGGRDDILICMY